MSNELFERDVEKYGHFRSEDWQADKEQYSKVFENYKSEVLPDTPTEEPVFNIRPNLIDSLQPFVNKRGVRNKLFKGDQHEVKVVQLDEIPGPAKLIYRDLDRCVGAMESIYINSIETAKDDMASAAKKLYKKAKKL